MVNRPSGSTYLAHFTAAMVWAAWVLDVKMVRPLVTRMISITAVTSPQSAVVHRPRLWATGQGGGGSRCSSSSVGTHGAAPGAGENMRSSATRGGSGSGGGPTPSFTAVSAAALSVSAGVSSDRSAAGSGSAQTMVSPDTSCMSTSAWAPASPGSGSDRGASGPAATSSSERSSSVDGRSDGSLCKASSSARPSSGPALVMGRGGSAATAARMAAELSPVNGGSPSTAKYRTAPSDQMSASGVPVCSGAMYDTAPTAPLGATAGSPISEAIPKSARWTSPNGDTNTFDGCRKRWTMSSSPAASSTPSSLIPSSATRSGSRGPAVATRWLRVGASISSVTTQGRSPSSTTSTMRARPG